MFTGDAASVLLNMFRKEKGGGANLPERPATNLRSVPGFAQISPVPFFLRDFGNGH
jgi:hypothetical protein